MFWVCITGVTCYPFCMQNYSVWFFTRNEIIHKVPNLSTTIYWYAKKCTVLETVYNELLCTFVT